ncbi:MAG: hypothetical protein IT578_10470 [Verrucomicrobiae bacterium]|nr:hypothetical protein [Verrucomicrobiae bacterium]
MKTSSPPWILALIATGLSAVSMIRAEQIFSLSFDNLDRTPVETAIYSDRAKTEVEKIRKSDSVRLVKGVKGLGVYLDSRYEFLALPESTRISAEHGAIAFWARPMPVESDGELNRSVLLVEFEKGRFQMLEESNFSVLNAEGHWDYGRTRHPEAASWEPGQWRFVVINWSAEHKKRQVFVDGRGGALEDYSPPAGKGRIYFSPLPTDLSGRRPICGVLDEITIYDRPLTEEAITAIYQEGVKALGKSDANSRLEFSLYPNLAKNATVLLSPKPNYWNQSWTCNGPDDEAKLSDGFWQLAWFATKRSVGWQGTSQVVLDYDLGALKEIGAVGINLGAGDAGVPFPTTATFYVGTTQEKLVKVGEVSTAEPFPNPEYPKWHNRLASVANVNRTARFVRIEIEGKTVFADEAFIAEKGAQPGFILLENNK